MSGLFYLLDERVWGNAAVWWGPDNAGYTTKLENAGKYTQEQIAANPAYYSNSQVTPVPCWIAESASHRCCDPGEVRVKLADVDRDKKRMDWIELRAKSIEGPRGYLRDPLRAAIDAEMASDEEAQRC